MGTRAVINVMQINPDPKKWQRKCIKIVKKCIKTRCTKRSNLRGSTTRMELKFLQDHLQGLAKLNVFFRKTVNYPDYITHTRTFRGLGDAHDGFVHVIGT